jgi:hypothetical protein
MTGHSVFGVIKMFFMRSTMFMVPPENVVVDG